MVVWFMDDLQAALGGQVQFKADKFGMVHASVGKVWCEYGYHIGNRPFPNNLFSKPVL